MLPTSQILLMQFVINRTRICRSCMGAWLTLAACSGGGSGPSTSNLATNFNWSPESGYLPLSVSFTYTSTDTPNFYLWDFGDGSTSNERNPTHVYNAAGSFDVTLTVTHLDGTSSSRRVNDAVSCQATAPVASFASTLSDGLAPLAVNFTDTSTNVPTSWEWDFENDGVVDSNLQNPTHVFRSAGLYSVRLVAANLGGAHTALRTNLIYAGPIHPNPTFNMVPLSPGTFQMGSISVGDTAVPTHQVTLSRPFWVGKHEVTQAEYQALMGSNPSFHQGSNYPNSAQRPVEVVSWNDAVSYCIELTNREAASGRLATGYQYRLPTEAEWEYFCRAGTLTDWNTGSTLSASQANFNNIIGQTTVVGSYPSNPWGLHDTHGNVWEWCLDSWDGTPNYTAAPATDPFELLGQYKTVRGGTYAVTFTADACRSARRGRVPPYSTPRNVGFRVVLAPTKLF